MRPLHVRPGVRYLCAQRGFCCRDLHLLGPLTGADVARLRQLAPAALEPDVASRTDRPGAAPAVHLRTVGGRCTLLDGTLCALHRDHGEAAKPSFCRRFPLGLVATPAGGRVTTAHRCPCRTLGDRRPLTPREAARSLRDAQGRLSANLRIPGVLRRTPDEALGFEAYAAEEAELLAALGRGDYPADVLGLAPELPLLGRASWREVAAGFRAARARGDAGGEALGCFGDGILWVLGERALGPATRSWAEDFRRAAAGAPSTSSPELVIGDFLADVLWGLRWVERGTFELAQAELVALWLVSLGVTARLVAAGSDAVPAAAEAVMVTELASLTGTWWQAVRDFSALREA